MFLVFSFQSEFSNNLLLIIIKEPRSLINKPSDNRKSTMKKTLTTLTSTSLFLFSLIACNAETVTNTTKEIISDYKNKIPTIKLRDDFSSKNPAWKVFEGNWQFKNSEVVQNSVDDYFPVILRINQQFSNLDISVNFTPVSGRVDASGGIIFRAKDQNNYYIVRANALEDNFRLYTFINGSRSQIASATVTPPSINKAHQIRVITKGNHIQAYLNNELKIDYHDNTFSNGYVGLWTKADSVTIFDDLKVDSLD